MKLLILLASTSLLFSNSALADGNAHAGHSMESMKSAESMDAKTTAPAAQTLKLEITPAANLEIGKTVKLTVKLIDIATKKPVGETALTTAHTRKLHLLVVDPSLSDYHHLHPVQIKEGEWNVDFTPLKNSSYRVWADVIPTATGKQEYLTTDIGTPQKEKTEEKATIDKKVNMVSAVGEYNFTLALDAAPKAGEAVMGSISVSKNGKPFTGLEPVMGAFAHVVGFSEDYKSIMHIHPLGKEPSKDSERGGAVLGFHIEPTASGFVKLFAQFRIEGKDVFVPFGVMVK